MTTLLDIDADFMLNHDHSHKPRGTKVVVSGKRLGNVLKRFRKPGTDIILEVDHQESLFWWDCYDIHDAYCIHIDAHHDMWHNWGITRGYRETTDCGSYLQQALYDHVVSKVLFVPSAFKTIFYEREDIREELGRRVKHKRFAVRSWESFQKYVHTYPKADIITISVSPEWFPRKQWPHIGDLARVLGASKEAIERTKEKAFEKWSGLRGFDTRPSYERGFRFPYAYTRSTLLKRLRQALREEKTLDDWQGIIYPM